MSWFFRKQKVELAEGEGAPTVPPPTLWREIVSYIGEIIRVFILSVAIIVPIRYFVIQPFYVKGASMEPNFYDHEYLIIDELSYRMRQPQRGEIIVFRYPFDQKQFFIKRVIGLPGETVIIKNGKVDIQRNNKEEKLQEPYLPSDIVTSNDTTVTLSDTEYFLLGDNRGASLDSRYFGAVKKDLVIGRVWLRGWPLNRITHFQTPESNISLK